MRLVIVLLVVVSAACTPATTPSAEAPRTSTAPATGAAPIKLGVLADVSGPFAPQGAEMRINTDLAVKQWNDTGGVDGRPVQADFFDPKSDPTQALQAATRFVQQDRVDVLVGAVGSNECAAVQELAPKLGVVYVTSSGCAAEEITAKTCNQYTFRFVPQGKQSLGPLARYVVNAIGPTWAVIYPDYAFGQSQLAAFSEGVRQAAGAVSVQVPVPLSETNLTPYVTRLPTDGSVVGVYDTMTGAQLTNSISSIQQFGISDRVKLVITGGKEGFGGTYPDVLTGAIFNSFSPEDHGPFMTEYQRNFLQMAQVDAQVANIIGGASNAKVGAQMGYSAYAAINAIKQSMRAVHYGGPGDTARLIEALANFRAQQSPDFPGGDVTMDPNDHQGRMTEYVSQIEGQREKVLSMTPADQVPPIGACKVSG
ncbi:MAG TPA: ABC transporter substrate-binding protein [Chloroflexota bacterium]|nr:ABC transporter substrate-binding protein [Chloroflexota bacterium]